ncbi:LysR family transcriptional regulator [Tropicimonas sp.]|uniref:LysR family transcriptional regulator n=1 Tax=Tropicimonas sp. TaxID=2067044 RepID=UPI003A8C2189
MLKEVNLNGMRYFEAVARLGQVARAAEELQVTTSAVSQQIRLLEQQFGVKLFRRHNRRLVPTEDGERLFHATSRAFRMVADVHSAIVRQRHSRQFIMRVSPSFGVRWLGPRIKTFLDRNPTWSVRVDATPEFTDFATETVDIDLRYGGDSRSGMYEICVMHDFILPMCSPEYLKVLSEKGDDPMEQIGRAQLIDSVKTLYRWDIWLPQQGVGEVPPVYALRFDRSSMAIQLAADGAGVILESALLAWRELDAGRLVPLSPRLPVIEFPGYHIVCPPRHTNRRIVRLFTDWMVAEGAGHEAEVRNYLERCGCEMVLEDGPSRDRENSPATARPMAPDRQ